MSETGWKCNSLTIPASQNSLIVNIPCEIFIHVCKFLPPIDLFTLSIVCKKFRNWLVARSNFGTEQIWKTARINWLNHLISPPSEMSEQCYVFLNLIELGCQFCGNGKIDSHGGLPYDIPARIYWCFRVRCCQRCFLERTVTSRQIEEEGQINSDLLRVLPYYFKKNRPLIYWRSQVEKVHQEYSKLDAKDLEDWMCKKSNQRYYTAMGALPVESMKKNQIIIRLKSIINNLSLIVPNDANRLQHQVEVELKRCPTYKKYTNDQKAKFAIRLFNKNHWDCLQNIIRNEYEEKRKYAALRARQFDIFRKVYSMVPEKFTMNDPIVKYLPYCRSFKCPYWNIMIPWKDNFFEELIPLLCDEAATIAKKQKPQKPIPITTLEYALKSSITNRRIFQCKLCGDSAPVLNYKEVKSHLQTPPHNVTNFHSMKKMIMINYLAVGKSILKRDSQLVCFFFPLDE